MIAQCSLISIIITIAIIQLIQCSDKLFPSHLEPYQSVRFSLFQSTDYIIFDKINHVALFSFDNILPEGDKSDLVIQLLNADSYKMTLYIFKDLNNLKPKYKDFSKADWKFDIDKRNEYILSKEDEKYQGNGTYYIAISTYEIPKEMLKSKPTIPYENEITVFNAQNKFLLTRKKLFVFHRLYSSPTFNFFINDTNECPYLRYQVRDLKNNSHFNLSIENESYSELSGYINVTTKTLVDIQVIPKITNSDLGNKFVISFELLDSKAELIKYAETKYSNNVVGKSEYYYYLDARNIDYLEERSISLFTNRYKPSVICKFIKNSMENFDFNNVFPLSSNENVCYLNQDRNSDSIYHVYFKRTSEDNTTLFMVSFDTEPLDFFSFSLELSKPATILTSENFVQKTLQLTSPRYFKFKVSEFAINTNLLIYVNLPDVMTVYYGDIYQSPNEIAEVKSTSQFFLINKTDTEFHTLPSITVSLFNDFTYETIIFETREFSSSEKLETIFIAKGEIRPEKQYQFQISNCEKKKILFFGIFNEISNNVMYMNTLYGKTKTLIRNDFEYGNKTLNAVIPNDENSIIFDKASNFSSNIDLISFTCEYPSLSYLNIIPYKPEEMEMGLGDIKLFYVRKENSAKVKLSNNSGGKYELNVLGWKDQFEIDVLVNGEKFITLNENNYLYRDTFTEKMVDATFEFISKGSENMISFKIGAKDTLYFPFSSNLTDIEENVLIYKYPVEKKDSTRKVTITFDVKKENDSRVVELCSYQNFGADKFIHLPTKFDCLTLTLPYTVTIENPYSKYVPQNKNYLDDDYFYVIFNFKTDSIKKANATVSYEEKIIPLKLKTGEFSYINKGFNHFLLEADENSESLNFQLTSCNGSTLKLDYYLSDDFYYTLSSNSKLFLSKNKNYKVGGDIVLSSSNESSIFRYFYQNATEYQFSPTMNLDIRSVLNISDKTLFLEFAPFVYNESVTYDIIIMNSSVLNGNDITKYTSLSTDFISLDNECFMYNLTEREENQKLYIKNTFVKTYTKLDVYELNYINITLNLSDYSTREKYILTMIARQNENSKMRALYYAIEFEFSGEGLNGLWITMIVVGCLILVFLGGYFIIGAIRKKRMRLSDLNSERDYQSL